MVAFQGILNAEYPSIGSGSISRPCTVGGQSEHKEGRALDWPLNAGDPSHRAIAKEVIDWLLAEDRYGNDAVMAKRLGIMYFIWNRKSWSSWGGWETYCEERARGCVDPEDKGLRSPHTDHMHFSMSRLAANEKTTFFRPERSMMSAIVAHPSYGYWELARNGTVASFGTGWYGGKSENFLAKPAVAMDSTSTGSGYWMTTQHGKVFGFGDARAVGGVVDQGLRIVDLEGAAKGNGYWLLSRSGRVSAFGSATYLGGARGKASFSGMAATSTGMGYWLFAENGKVFAFGDAKHFGDLSDKELGSAVIGGDDAGDSGYWLATQGGRVAGFGSAASMGAPESLDSPVVGFAASPDGSGYWVLTKMGQLFTFGEAPDLGTLGD